MYQLKPDAPEFECVDGPLAGRKFLKGEVYAAVPAGDQNRFDIVPDAAPSPGPSPAGGEGQVDKDKSMGGKKK